jgi:hypothetical protein
MHHRRHLELACTLDVNYPASATAGRLRQPVSVELVERRLDVMSDTRRSLSRQDRATLRAVVEAYERLTQNARALTAGQIRQRDELLRTIRGITGYTGRKSGIKLARQMIDGIDPARAQPRKARYAPNPDGKRPPDSNWDFDATHVDSIVSVAIESSRRRH